MVANKSRNIAIVLAGGIGSRLNAGIPKQFLKVAGLTVIEHTITIFEHHPKIDEIAVVVSDAYMHKISEYAVKNNFTKLRKILSGGAERHYSSLSAIKAYEQDGDCNLIFHDAVRPLLSPQIIDRVIDALKQYDAVDVAIPSADTIIEIDKQNCISAIPNRKILRRGQTPQGFRLSTIQKAYKLALSDPDFITTDDCGVVLKYLPDTKIYVVDGEDANMKLTYAEDLYLIEKLFQLKTTNFQDATISEKEIKQLRGRTVVIFGASSGIGADLAKICEMYGSFVFGYSRSISGTDITCVDDIKQALAAAASSTGKIDYVVDTASVLNKLPLAHMDYGTINQAIDINYRGMVNVAKEAFPYLKQTSGHLLFYTSSSYTRGRMDYSIYSSTKCATVNFVQALAEEWNCFGIRVNCINPERTKTPMRVKNFGIEDETTLLKSQDVANVSAKVLVSDITGQVIDVKIKKV